MKILRNVLLCVLFVVAVFISSANVQLVEIVYLPATGLDSGWQPRAIQLPLFVIVLGDGDKTGHARSSTGCSV